jgi:hypothetical protein
MSAIWAWILSGWLHLAIGFVLGWIVLKRPELVDRLVDWIKEKIGLS